MADRANKFEFLGGMKIEPDTDPAFNTKVIYGRAECGLPCRITLDADMVARIAGFQSLLDGIKQSTFNLRDNETVQISIRDLDGKSWDIGSEEDPGAYIRILPNVCWLAQAGYDGENTIAFFDKISDIPDVLFTEDALEYMNDQDDRCVHEEIWKEFKDNLPKEHLSVFDIQFDLYLKERKRRDEEYEARMREQRGNQDGIAEQGS